MTAMKAKQTMDVERIVTWALLDQGLGWSMYGEGNSPAGFAELGTRIDTSGIGAPNPSRLSDNDALVVRDVVNMLPDDAKDLVVRYGRIGERPDWCEEGLGDYEPVLNRRGQPMYVYAIPGNRRSKKAPKMQWVGWRQADLDYWRATYRLWWHALNDIVPELNSRLETHEARPPSAPFEPWLLAKPVIHTPDGPIDRRRQKPANTGEAREFVMLNGRYERYDPDRHGPSFERPT